MAHDIEIENEGRIDYQSMALYCEGDGKNMHCLCHRGFTHWQKEDLAAHAGCRGIGSRLSLDQSDNHSDQEIAEFSKVKKELVCGMAARHDPDQVKPCCFLTKRWLRCPVIGKVKWEGQKMIIVEIVEALLAYEAYGKRASVIFLGETCLRELEVEMAKHGQMPSDGSEYLFTVDDRPVRTGDFPANYIGFRAD